MFNNGLPLSERVEWHLRVMGGLAFAMFKGAEPMNPALPHPKRAALTAKLPDEPAARLTARTIHQLKFQGRLMFIHGEMSFVQVSDGWQLESLTIWAGEARWKFDTAKSALDKIQERSESLPS